MKKKLILFILLTVLTAVLTLTTNAYVLTAKPATLPGSFVMVIDAGHGGADMGASAPDGTGEPEITLAVAQELARQAEQYGITPILTRKDHNGLMENPAQGRWSKLSDMRQRRNIIREAEPKIIISIHLNSFTEDTDVRGAQVFYPDEQSKPLAEAVSEALIGGINDGTERQPLQKKDMYLFQESAAKRILVECGFLSNPVDLAVLKTKKHQKMLAQYIMEGVRKEEKISEKLPENAEVIDSRTKTK